MDNVLLNGVFGMPAEQWFTLMLSQKNKKTRHNSADTYNECVSDL
jgi:hypothetical protein